MAYRNLTFRSLASDIRTETYLGEDHIVIPCIALVGDEVVYGMNADGPEFIPAEELEFSTLGWSGRPVLYDHPSNSTSTANEPATLEAMSFGQIFHPRFEDNKLKVEAYCNKRRALEIGQEDLITSIENGEVIELSVGAIISLEKKSGVAPNGKPYTAIWHDVQSDHLAIGLSGSQGACNIEMGCGANRVLKANSDSDDDDTRTMRANRGEVNMNDQPKPKPAASKAVTADKAGTIAAASKSQTPVQKILSFASRIFRSNTEDEGLSDFDLRSKLWDVLYSIEPAFSGIEDVYQDSKTVRYITNPTYPEHKMYLWRRTFDVAEDGTVTVNDDREEVDFAVNYIYLANGEKPCGCQSVSTDQVATANDSKTDSKIATDNDQPKEDINMPDDNKPKTDATPPASGTPATSTPPATPAPGTTTPPVQPVIEEIPKTTETAAPATTVVTTEQLKALLEDHPLIKHYRAQEAKERTNLIASLVKKQTVLTQAQLEAKPIEELRTYAEFLGVGTVAQAVSAGDFSGRMMVDAGDDVEIKPVPNVWEEARKLRAQKKAGAAS